MDDDAAGEGFVSVLAQIEIHAEPAGDFGKVVGRRLHGREAARSLDSAVAAREALARQQRREIAALGGAPGMKGLAHGAEHLAQTCSLGRGEPERPHHVPARQVEELADRGRRSEHARSAGDVPARFVVRGVHRVSHAGFGLEPEDEREQEVTACHGLGAGIREQRRGHRRGRVDVILGRGVVVIVYVRADAVEQRGVQRVQPLRAAQHVGNLRAGERGHGPERDFHRGLARAAYRAADVVEQRAMRLVPHVLRDALEPAGDDVRGKFDCGSHSATFRGPGTLAGC